MIGSSDAIAAYPDSEAYSPDDIGATVYTAPGHDPQALVRDRLNRPVQLNTGTVIEKLYGG